MKEDVKDVLKEASNSDVSLHRNSAMPACSSAECQEQICRHKVARCSQQRRPVLCRAVAGEQRGAGCQAACRALL